MADQERKNGVVVDLRKSDEIGEEDQYRAADYLEETSAEIAAPAYNRGNVFEEREEAAAGGQLIGYVALALSILSLFVSPILFGAAGIVLGFLARRRGAEGIGSWSIGIGAVSIIVGMFVLPFY